MKIMIIGSTGMAGHLIYNILSKRKDFELISVSYRNKLNNDTLIFDFFDKDKIYNFLLENKPKIIINCVGVLIKDAINFPEKAIYTNSFLPHYLSKICRDIDCKLIHLSTDCVFSGNIGMYNSKDNKDAQDIYGMSKALGELNNNIDLTIRTSIIGPELKENGQGLLHWFLNQNGTINGFTSAYWSGITTLQLATIIEQAIDSNLSGLFQYSNNEKISKFELLSIFKKTWNKDKVLIIPSEGKIIDKSLISDNSDTMEKAPSYQEMCNKLAKYMNNNKEIYSQYL